MEHLPPGGRESPAGRNHKMHLLGPLGHGQPVVAHSGLAGEEPSMNARQHNRALSTRDTDNPMLIGDELTGSHKRGNMTALGAGQVKVPNAHRSIAATNNGEQVCAQGAHGVHCRPAAEWVQPGRRHSVDNWSIRQPVASRTHRSVTDVVTQNCHPCPETQHPVAEDGVQIGHKGAQQRFTQRYEPLNHAVLSGALSTRCRLCIRFGHSPPLQGPLHARNHTGGRSPASPLPALTRIRTGRLTPPPRPSRGPSWCCRADPTSTDQVAGSCGRSRSDSLGP